MRLLVVKCIQIYRFFFSQAIHLLAGPGYGCRFDVTCSEYAIKSVERLGVMRGLYQSARRLAHCHPFASVTDKDLLDVRPSARKEEREEP